MSLENEMEIIKESWARNPIPDDFKTIGSNQLLCSEEGVQKQIEMLASGQGLIRVAFVNENALNSIEIKTFTVFKQ